MHGRLMNTIMVDVVFFFFELILFERRAEGNREGTKEREKGRENQKEKEKQMLRFVLNLAFRCSERQRQPLSL